MPASIAASCRRGGAYGAMTEVNAFAQQQYPGRMTGLMHVDEARAGTEAELAKVDHAFHALKLGGPSTSTSIR